MDECKYYKTVDGKFIAVPTMEECLNAINTRYQDAVNKNKHLSEENKKLKEEHYKDEEMIKMKEELERARNDLHRGFAITEEELKKIKEWTKLHDTEAHGLNTEDKRCKAGGVIGGRYSYCFTPTSIGTIGVVKCSCGAEFTFCDLS